MWRSLSLFRANVECPFGSPVFIPCESVPLSVFLWTCHLQPSRPTLPPSHSSPNSELMPTSCWPLTHIFIFFLFLATSRAFSLFLCSWKPHLFKCPLCDRYTSHRLCTQHPLGGGRWPSLSIAVSVCDHPPILYSSLAALFYFILLCPSLFSHPFFPCPPACLHVHEADFHRSSPLC